MRFTGTFIHLNSPFMKKKFQVASILSILVIFCLLFSCKNEQTNLGEIQIFNESQIDLLLQNAVIVEATGEPIVTVNRSMMGTDTIVSTKSLQYFKVWVAINSDNTLVLNPKLNDDEIAELQGKIPVVIGRACGFSCKRNSPSTGGELCPLIGGCAPIKPSGCSEPDCGSECTIAQTCKEEKSGFKFGSGIIF